MKIIKVVLGIVFSLVAVLFLLMFLQMFFILAIRGVYLSETAGLLLAFFVWATLAKWTFQSVFRKKTPQPPASIRVDATKAMAETANAMASHESHPTLFILRMSLLGGLCLGGIGTGYGA